MKRFMSLSLALVLFITMISSVGLISFASDKYDPSVINSNVKKIEDYIYKNGYRNAYGEYSIEKDEYSDDYDYTYIIKNDTEYKCLHFMYYLSEPYSESELIRVDMIYSDDYVTIKAWTANDDYATISGHSYIDGLYHHEHAPSSIYIDKNISSLNDSAALSLCSGAMADAFDSWDGFLKSEMGLNLGAIGYFEYCTNHSFETTTSRATCTKDGVNRIVCQVCGDLTEISIPKISTIKLSSTDYIYDGKIKTPTVTIKDSAGKKLVKGTDYTISYSKGRKSIGKYSVKIKFIGAYEGTVTKDFSIVPKATSISSLTASSKGFVVKWKKQANQTTGYQIQIATDSKFKKGVKSYAISKNSTVSKNITNLIGKKKYYVRIRTYKTVGKTTCYSSWSNSKTVVTK